MEKDTQHSIDFITKKTGKNSGFSIPEKYFEELEECVVSEISTLKLPTKKTPFNIPTDYFSKLEDEILTKITSEENTLPKKRKYVILLQERIKTIIPYASVASILLFIGAYFFNNYGNKTTIDDITIDDLENWYGSGYENINNTEMIMILETSDFDNEEITSVNITDETIENYLNSVDTNTLLNNIP